MKKFSAPPMIIILDILFIVLFITVLEKSPNINIKIPPNKLLKDTIVLNVNSQELVTHWYDTKTSKWIEWSKYPQGDRKYSYIIGDIDCNENSECKSIQNIGGKKIISIRGNLYDDISGLISDSCLRFPKECSNVTYYVKQNGEVDRDRLKKDYPIFSKLLN